MLLRLIKKKTGIALLVAMLLFILSACSDLLQGGEEAENPADTPDTEHAENNGDNNDNNNKIDDLNTKQDNEEDIPGNASDSQADSDPEDILKNYYYGIVDKPIVDFELEDLQGNKVRLSDFKGKVVFLNFWATWCPSCREEMPYKQEFHENYGDEVILLSVNPSGTETFGAGNSKQAEKKVREFIEQEGYTFPILLDRDDAVWSIYRQRGIPANYMIDKEGIVKYLKPGPFISLQEMEDFARVLGANMD